MIAAPGRGWLGMADAAGDAGDAGGMANAVRAAVWQF